MINTLIFVPIFQLELTHSAMPPKGSEGFQINKCSYGPTTTQQQAHNRTPAGFFKIYPCTESIKTKTQTQNTQVLCKREANQIKSIQIPISERMAIYQHHNHSTKHKTTLVKD